MAPDATTQRVGFLFDLNKKSVSAYDMFGIRELYFFPANDLMKDAVIRMDIISMGTETTTEMVCSPTSTCDCPPMDSMDSGRIPRVIAHRTRCQRAGSWFLRMDRVAASARV